MASHLAAAELTARMAEMRAVGDASLIGAGRAAAARVLRFRADPGIRDRLEALIVAESQCCGFLGFELRDEGAALALTLTGPALAAPALAAPDLDALVGAFGADALR